MFGSKVKGIEFDFLYNELFNHFESERCRFDYCDPNSVIHKFQPRRIHIDLYLNSVHF